MVTPYINEKKEEGNNENKVLKTEDDALQNFYKILLFLDNSNLKKLFGKIALKVVRDGCFYGYIIPKEKRVNIQDLPIDYCRSRFEINNRPVVEFNMKYFDEKFKDATLRQRILKVFGPEFEKGYRMYKKDLLPPQFPGDSAG